jgi:2-polyprenyl-6-hydroxyphenyl methylase/3-demethylubiquinone-9 3-methyltransferase
MPTLAPRNHPALYDELVEQWWQPGGDFAALHWQAASRASLIPPPEPGDTLVDLGCGGGLMAPWVRGYEHVGVDLVRSGLQAARRHGVHVVRADAGRLPLPDSTAEVVVAGELLEHVPHPHAVLAEAARVLRPGRLLVFDTINRSLLARVLVMHVGERLPGGPPPRIHDPTLFISPRRLRSLLAAAGFEELRMWGLRPHLRGYLRFLADRSQPVEMVRTRFMGALYQGTARKP